MAQLDLSDPSQNASFNFKSVLLLFFHHTHNLNLADDADTACAFIYTFSSTQWICIKI